MSPCPLFASLFAQVPTWTDKEVITAIVSVVGGLLAAFGIIIRYATRRSRAKAREAEGDKEALAKEIDGVTDSSGAASLEEVRLKADDAQRQDTQQRGKA